MLAHLRDHAPPDISKPEYHDLDKSWHILHWALTGQAEGTDTPDGALLGGTALGPCGGYGPVRLLSPSEVAAFAEVLAPLDAAQLSSRTDPEAMRTAGVAFTDDPDMVAFEIEDHFPRFQKFVATTARKKRGLLLILE
ncbi:MAG: DUF1877 family protein [Pseudomonadota bacterium]